MAQIARYLQEHLSGEVTDNLDARRHFSTDASILKMTPQVVAYPQNEDDIRKTMRFCWELAQRGQALPVTARGGGSSTSGAAIGNGVLLAMTAHMNQVLEIDFKKQLIAVEAGANFDKLEEVLFSHGYWLPPCPASSAYATVGGAIASNAIGDTSSKYGSIGNYVRGLRVVLANGEVIETRPLNKKELDRKLGLPTFEGEIYRSLDTLIEENQKTIEEEKQNSPKITGSTGYNLAAVKTGKDFDLTPLFVGSLGSLGVITEAVFYVVTRNIVTSMAAASFGRLKDLDEILPEILKLVPSRLDFMNAGALNLISENNPSILKSVAYNPKDAIHLFVEFDDDKEVDQSKALHSLVKIFEKAKVEYEVAKDEDDKDKFKKIRQSVSSVLAHPKSTKKAIPITEDVFIPPNKLMEFLDKAGPVFESVGQIPAAWGYAGVSLVRLQPMLDLKEVGDRQKLFKIAEEIFGLAKSMGGGFSAAAGDGRLRAPFTQSYYSQQYYKLITNVKKIFDPRATLNKGVKTSSLEEVKALLREDYELETHLRHLPRS